MQTRQLPGEFKSGSHWRHKVVTTAVKLDLFGHLALHPSTATSLASDLGGDPRAFRIVLDALTALKLLGKRGQTYVNTPLSDKYLVPGRSEYQGDQLIVDDLCWTMWDQLEEALLRGSPAIREPIFKDNPLVTEHLLRGLHQEALSIAPKIGAAIDLSQHHKVLDLGGGGGTYALCFVRDNPFLRASVFELPQGAAIARQFVDSWGLQDRISVLEGNFLEDKLPRGHDLIFMSNVLHGNSAEQNATLFERVAQAVEPGGRIVVRDVIMDPDLTSPEFGAIFSVNMLLHTAEGRCYSSREIMRWMDQAGLKDLRHIEAHSLIVSQAPS